MNDNLVLNFNIDLHIDMPDNDGTGGVYFGDGRLLNAIIPIKDFANRVIAYQFRDELFTNLEDILQYIQNNAEIKIHFVYGK